MHQQEQRRLKKDPARVKGAATAAKRMQAEAQSKADTMKKIAGVKTPAKTTVKSTTRKK